MANETVNGRCNSSSVSTNNSESRFPTESEESSETSGWLMKRTRLSHKWKRTWFCLKNTDLYYGHTEQDARKKIPLEAAEIAESNIDNKENAFRIRIKEGKRTYYVYATDTITQSNWMQAICFAKAAQCGGETASQACLIQ